MTTCTKTVDFIKGYFVLRVIDLDKDTFAAEAATREANPYHMHITIRNFKVPFSAVDSVSDILPEDTHYQLDMLQKKAYFVEVDPNTLTAINTPAPCSICNKA